MLFSFALRSWNPHLQTPTPERKEKQITVNLARNSMCIIFLEVTCFGFPLVYDILKYLPDVFNYKKSSQENRVIHNKISSFFLMANKLVYFSLSNCPILLRMTSVKKGRHRAGHSSIWADTEFYREHFQFLFPIEAAPCLGPCLM